jgi:xanthine dehydrogenase accessory factor
VLASGKPQLLHFGVADDTAWEVGLACGGTIEVFVEPLKDEWFDRLRESLVEEQPVASATVVSGPDSLLGHKLVATGDDQPQGEIGGGADEQAAAVLRDALASGRSGRVPLTLPGGEPAEVFVEVNLPSPTLIMVGGVHIAIALASLAKALGYRTVVVDPRKSFGSETRFPHVDQLIQAWPDEALTQVGLNRSTAVAMLTHDPKLDDPGLQVALPSPAFYVGALGSQKTQARRRERLLEAGLTEAQLDRLHGPIGLDLGARTPEEVALSVMAEVVAAKNGRDGNGRRSASSAG